MRRLPPLLTPPFRSHALLALAVFLHTSPYPPVPELQESEVASAHWIPLDLLHAPAAKYGSVPIDIATRLAPRNKVARWVLHMLVGQMDFKCVALFPFVLEPARSFPRRAAAD